MKGLWRYWIAPRRNAVDSVLGMLQIALNSKLGCHIQTFANSDGWQFGHFARMAKDVLNFKETSASSGKGKKLCFALFGKTALNLALIYSQNYSAAWLDRLFKPSACPGRKFSDVDF